MSSSASWSTVRSCTARPGGVPTSADLLYVYRPLAEIDGILTDAQRMGVRTIWRQPEVRRRSGPRCR